MAKWPKPAAEYAWRSYQVQVDLVGAAPLPARHWARLWEWPHTSTVRFIKNLESGTPKLAPLLEEVEESGTPAKTEKRAPESPSPGFLELWVVWKKRGDRKASWRRYQEAILKVRPDLMLQCAGLYKDSIEGATDRGGRPMLGYTLEVWLNQERWEEFEGEATTTETTPRRGLFQ